MKENISDLINSYISNSRSALPSFRKEGIHPSEIGETPFCVRKQIFKLIDKENNLQANTYSSRTYKIFDIGHALHDQWRQKYLGPSGKLFGQWRCSRCHSISEGFQPTRACKCAHNYFKNGSIKTKSNGKNCINICGVPGKNQNLSHKKINSRGGCIHCGKWGAWEYQEYSINIKDIAGIPGLDVVGHVDGILQDEFGNKKVLDIKTINQTGYEWVTRPKDTYINQLHLYMKALHIYDGIILYVNKTNGEMKPFDVVYDESRIIELEGRIRMQHESLNALELPQMHPKCTPRSRMRQYCPFGGFSPASSEEECRGACSFVDTKEEFIDFYSGKGDEFIKNKPSPPPRKSPVKKQVDWSNSFNKTYK